VNGQRRAVDLDSWLPGGMKRVVQLDGVRGLAILLVLVWHCFASRVIATDGSMSVYCVSALLFTRSGVTLFFVLSGFLIGGILLDHRQTENYFRIFYLRRICRILPLYFLTLALFMCFRATPLAARPYFEWLAGHPFPMLSYATFTQNFLMATRGDYGPHWLGVTWSLAIEEQFYLFVPLLVFFLPRRALLLVLPVGILMAPVLRHSFPAPQTYVYAPWRADALLSGVSLALLVRSRSFIDRLRRWPQILFALLIAFLLGILLLDDEFRLVGLFAIFILIAYADTQPWLGKLLRKPVLIWFGQLSYGIYMFHEAVSGLTHGLLLHTAPQLRTPADVAVTLLALAITLLLAALSYRFFEGPILRFGHRFRYRPNPSPEPLPQELAENT
jgi:peptidoglycan/LPS O-acetylase OafA/YrhL